MTNQQICAIANGSGSAGKTSTALSLASLHAQQCPGARTLLVDLDPQGNATSGAGADTKRPGVSQAIAAASANNPRDWPDLSADDLRATLAPLMDRLIQPTEYGFDVLGSGTRAQLQYTVSSLSSVDQRSLLKLALAALPHQTIILDCHGDLGAMTQAALEAANAVIAVSVPASKEASGIPELLAEVARLRSEGTSAAVVAALVPTIVRSREVIASRYMAAFEARWPDLLTSSVRSSTVVGQAAATRAPVVDAFPDHPITQDYREVYMHLVKKGVLSCPK